jgi:hypothetical protein
MAHPGSAKGTLSPVLKLVAPQTICLSPAPSLTRQSDNLSALGCFENLAHNDFLKLATNLDHTLDFNPHHGQTLSQFFRGPGKINIFLQPVQSNFHKQKNTKD